MEQTKNRRTGAYVIFALVCLFNPNINLIDFLPDFIGYFILAKVFLLVADAAPYFEEARSSFVKLAYINIAKIGGIMLIGLARSKNTADYDIYALLSLAFAILELIFLLPAVSNIFKSLTYLGQRTSAKSLIESSGVTSVDSLCAFTYVFSVLKCILYVIPELLRMTGSVDGKENLRYLYYPGAVAISLIFGFIIGSVWLIRMIRYVSRVRKEGLFHSALHEIASKNSLEDYEKKVYLRSVRTTFAFFVIASVFSADIMLAEFNEVNLIPEFIFGILFSIGLLRLCRHIKLSKKLRIGIITLSSVYTLTAIISYAFSIRFLDNFGYKALIGFHSDEAYEFFLPFEIASLIEMIFVIAISAIFFIIMNKFNENLKGNSKALTLKTGILASLSSLTGIMHFLDIYQNSRVELVSMNSIDYSQSTVVSAAIPWFGTLVTACVIFFVLYSVYYFNMLKEEIGD